MLDLLYSVLVGYEFEVRVVEHYSGGEGEIEYLNVRVTIPGHGVVVIREFWDSGRLVAYGYYLRVGGHEEWWDNRPHHPELETHPNHRHVGGETLPLREPSLKGFLDRLRVLLEARRETRGLA